MPTELKELELMEVSLVDAGDDPLAKVALFKRHPESETMDKELAEKGISIEIEIKSPEEEMMDMQLEAQQEANMSKSADTQTEEGEDEEAVAQDEKPMRKSWKAEAETLKALNEELEAKVEVLEKALEDAKAVEKAKVTQEEMIEVDGVAVAKAAVPAPILKKLENLQKAAEKAELCKRADELLPNLKGTSEERGELLKAVGESESLLSILKAADAAMAGSFEEIGKEKTEDFTTAQEELDALIEQVMTEKGVSKPKATAEVTATAKGKALYKQVMKDRK